MSTITLSANKINMMPLLIIDASNAVKSYKSELQTLKLKLLTIDNSVCNLEDVISSIKASSQTQEDKIESLNTLNKDMDEFVSDVARIDSEVANAINKSKDDFYDEYEYLKPECEKSWLEKAKEWIDSACEWCKDLWNKIIDFDFFNFIGKLIHSEGFRNFVTFVVGIFYQIGGVWLIKKIAELGTIAAVFVRKHPILSSYIPGLNIVADMTTGFFSLTLGADMDDDGIYHMRPDCLQQYAHYTTGYDDVFRAAVNKASGGEITVDVHQSKIFWVDLDSDGLKDEGEEFIIWSWKGDYMNLGAGAETGIYQVKDGEFDKYGNYIMENGEYSYLYGEVNREYSVKMTLELYYDSNGDSSFSHDERLYDYKPNEPQWWITGFDPLVQNVKSDDLKAVTTIDFSSYGGEKGELFYEALKKANYNEKRDAYDEWIWDDEDLTVTLDWGD